MTAVLDARVRVERPAFRLDAEVVLEDPVTALFGPSGSGKTTFLHAVAGLVRPAAGRVAVGGEVLADDATGLWVPPARRRVGLVFQDLRLFPHRSVHDNLTYGWRRVPEAARSLRPDEVVEVLGLGGLLARRPDQLSGGERQRVALGRALLAHPRLLLLDEPLAGVDVGLRRQILPYLRWVVEHLEWPLVYVSHGLEEILALTDRMCALVDGRVVAHGEVFDVLERTAHGRAGEAFTAASVVPVEVEWPDEEGRWVRARCGGQTLLLPFQPMSTGQIGRVAVRPEDVMLARVPLEGVSARNQLRGEVSRITGLHGRLLVHVTIAPDVVLHAEITEGARGELGLDRGATVVCVVKTSSFHWL